MRVVLRKRGDVIAKKATTIAIVNQKGGTAKTTTCENLGIGLAMEGKKVLLVDVDPQGSLTISMGWQQPDELSTTLSTLMAKAMNDQSIQPGEGILHHAEGVDLIPANIELAGMEVALVNSMNREKMLKQVLDSAKREYDYILLDCTPSLGMLTVNALAAADTTLIPMQAQYLSAKGLEQLLQTIGKVRRQINPKLKIEGILLTMTDNRTIYGQQISNLIRQGYGKHLKVFNQTIPRSIRAAEISTTGKSIYQHAKSSYHNDNLISGEKTCDRIAKENGVNRITVIRAEKFANCVDEAEKISPGSRQKILSGTVKGTAKDIMSLARTPPEERSALVEKICMPKEPKKFTNKSSSTTKKKKVKKKQPDAVEELSCSVETIPAVIEEPPKPQKALTELQTIRVLSNKMESVEQVADAEGMLSEVESAADAMIYRLDVCFEHYPEFLKNPNIRQKVVELLQKAKAYIVKLEGEFAYD